jgi:hypothetical protein
MSQFASLPDVWRKEISSQGRLYQLAMLLSYLVEVDGTTTVRVSTRKFLTVC